MIKFEYTDVYGFDTAIRGMRNPKNSWDKSDSFRSESAYELYLLCGEAPDIGTNDLTLMRNLAKAGNDHGKFARMINVTVDIEAPLYWWKEFDTYKVGTVANSCSTMHKIHAKEFTLDDFSHEHLMGNDGVNYFVWDIRESHALDALNHIIYALNFYRDLYLKTRDKRYWWQMIQLLPSSYNQKRTIQLNYQVLWSMYQARKSHKLDEWHDFCAWCESLPYFKEIFLEE